MNETETQPDTLPIPAFMNEIRRARRYACHIKTLYSKRGDGKGLASGEATWNMGRIVDVSQYGLGLVLQRAFVPGAILCLEPLLLDWKSKEPLRARVTNVRLGPGTTLIVGCEFTRALDGDELQVFLLNAR
jgi:hypothetical protein